MDPTTRKRARAQSELNAETFKKNKANTSPRPPQSPDLNVIENLWIDLQKAVHSRQPRNLGHLEQICQIEWSRIKLERIQKLLNSYPKEIGGGYKGKGWMYKVLENRGCKLLD